MKKRFAALLLMLMMVLQILIPAYAREETPIPFSITALQADEEKILVLDGLYLDGRFYAMASDMSELLRGTQAYKEGGSFSFTAHGKSRRFRAEPDKKTLLECNALTEGKWQIDTQVPVLFADGICYVSLTHMLTYCGAVYSISAQDDVNLLYKLPYTFYDCITDLAALGEQAYFSFDQLGYSEKQLRKVIDKSAAVTVLSRGKTLIDWAFRQDDMKADIVEEVLLDIVEQEGGESTVPSGFKTDKTILKIAGAARSAIILEGEGARSDTVRMIDGATRAYKEADNYVQMFASLLHSVARLEALSTTQRELLDRTLVKNAKLCPSLADDNRIIYETAERLSFKMQGQMQNVVMESAEIVLDTAISICLGGFTPGKVFSGVPGFTSSEKLLTDVLGDELMEDEAFREMMKLVSSAFDETKGKLKDILGIKQFFTEQEKLFDAWVSGLISYLANEQLLAHYECLGREDALGDYAENCENVKYALILQLKAAIMARQYMLDSKTKLLDEAMRSRLQQEMDAAAQLLCNAESMSIAAPRSIRLTEPNDLYWMQEYWEAAQGIWVIDQEMTGEIPGMYAGSIDAERALLTIEQPDWLILSLRGKTEASEPYKHVGRYLVFNDCPENLSLYLEKDSRGLMVRGKLEDLPLYWKQRKVESNGICLYPRQIEYGEVLRDCFDFDGDGEKDSLFCDYFADTLYLYVLMLPSAQMEKWEANGGHASSYQEKGLYFMPWEQYYSSTYAGLAATYTNASWPDPDAVNCFGMELQSLGFLRAEDGCLYAGESACIWGAAGWPELYVTLYQQAAETGKMERLEADFGEILSPETGDHAIRQEINAFKSEYVPELKQWCFVIYQYVDSDNDYARTCFTLRDGCIQVLARYLGDQQL